MCDSRLASVPPTHFYSDDKRFFATILLKPCREFNPSLTAAYNSLHSYTRFTENTAEKWKCCEIARKVSLFNLSTYRTHFACSRRDVFEHKTRFPLEYMTQLRPFVSRTSRVIPACGTGTCVNNYWPSKNYYKYTLLVWPSRYFYKRILYIRTVFM